MSAKRQCLEDLGRLESAYRQHIVTRNPLPLQQHAFAPTLNSKSTRPHPNLRFAPLSTFN